MKRYVIAAAFGGYPRMTNSLETALHYAACGDFCVIDAEDGVWIRPDGERVEMKELPCNS